MIRALLFDAAGTLLEPAEPVADVYARYFLDHGWQVEPGVVKAVFARLFRDLPGPDYGAQVDGDVAERQWWRVLVRETLRGCGIDPAGGDACFRQLFDHYAEPAAWRFFPETHDVLQRARAAGLRLAVVSNFDRRLHRLLRGLPFEFVLTSADARARKPDTAIFRLALERLGLQASQVMHAGDSPEADVMGAGAVGIRAYLIQRPATDLQGFFAAVNDFRGK